MNKYYKDIINNIGNTYNYFINISTDENLSIFNIELGEFAQIKLKLKNIKQNRDKVLEEITRQSEIILLDIKKHESGYLLTLYINNKEERYKVSLFCEDMDCDIQFWDYSKIKISEDENKDNYRVLLAVKEAKNLLMKRKLFDENALNYKERNLVKNAVLIIILSLLQLKEQYNDSSYLDSEDLFKNKDENIEREALQQALQVIEFYIGKIKEAQAIKEKIEYYLNNPKKLMGNRNDNNSKKDQKNISNYQNHCYYYQSIYRIYSDFSIAIENSCKEFECKYKTPNTKFAIDINDYIQNKIIPILKQNGFEGEYPCFVYKDCKKIYIISFQIMPNKVVIKYDDKNIDTRKIRALLENIDYKEIKPEDFCVYLTSECLDSDAIGECVSQFIEDLKVYKQIEFNEYDDNIINKPYESKAGILERILFRFKKQKNQ